MRKRMIYSMTRLRLNRQIKAKWNLDRQRLPLTQAHRELYVVIHLNFWRKLSDFPDLVNCRDYNDKIQWLMLFDQRWENVQCSDKIEVRNFVRERVGEAHLVRLYQTADQLSEIDFDSLPNSFVIKANHDSGTVVLVPDKSRLDTRAIAKRITRALLRPYGRKNGEWAYPMVRPRVLVEEYIGSESGKAPADFKLHCVDGKVKWLQYIFDRGPETKEVIAFEDGAVTPIHFDDKMLHSDRFELPAQWKKLKMIAEALSEGFKYVRVDLYVQHDRVFVGELTFFPRAGCYGGDGQRELGRMLDFDRSTFLPVISGKALPS